MSKQYCISENIYDGSFEEFDNIAKETFEMNFSEKEIIKDGMPLISNGHIARGYYLEQPMMVIGATGSGKTRRLIIPYLTSCIMSGTSVLVNDPKGELYKHTHKLLQEFGYKEIVVDYRDLSCGDRFNFCEYPAKLYQNGNTTRADEIFQAMFDTLMNSVKSEKDPFWHTTSATYVTGLAELACDILPLEMVTINNIFELHIQGNKKFGGTTYFHTYFDLQKEKKPYYKLISPYINSPNETKASLDAVLTSVISKFCRNESVIDQTANSTFSMRDLVKEKTALFIISRDESTVYNAFISAMVSQIYETIIDYAEEKCNGRLERRLAIVLDEFGNLAPIADINEKITVSRSRNVGWCLGCQSLDQLNLKYGQDIAKIIIGNCNLAYMFSNDIALLKMISDLCGKTTDEYTHDTRPLLSIEQLRHFDKKEGETLFLLERMRPFIGFLPDITKYNVIPVIKSEYKKRKPQKLTGFDFEAFVKNEKRKDIEKKLQEIPYDFSLPPLPETMNTDEHGLTPYSKPNETMIDRKDLIDQKRVDTSERTSVDFYVVVKRMPSIEKTISIISSCLNLSIHDGKKVLKDAFTNKNGKISNLSRPKATYLAEKLNECGIDAVWGEEELPFN